MSMKFNFNKDRKDCFFLIAGPCVIENEKINFETAEALKEITTKHSIPFIFKSSLYKANRNHPKRSLPNRTKRAARKNPQNECSS